jgi:hypothetical protein
MDSYKKVMSERGRPLREAWDELREEVDSVMIAMTPTGRKRRARKRCRR